MGRKKKYSKTADQAKPAPAPDEESEASSSAGTPPPDSTVIETTAEVTDGAPAGAPVAGRPEWAIVAPGRLEAAEDESFWFAFALAVMACAPPMMGVPAAILASVLCFRILRALWSVPADVAPDDIGSARMMLFATVFFSVMFKVAHGAVSGIISMMVTVFFFNALHNVRVMVTLAAKGGPKKAKKQQREAASRAEIEGPSEP